MEPAAARRTLRLMVGTHHLVGVAFSHYVEKARWALERHGVPYTEERYLPLLHMPRAAWVSRGAGRADRVSSRFSTPILVTDAGARICDSSAIVRYVSDRFGGHLYDDPEAVVWERRFHDRLAPATRRVGYALSLDDPDAMEVLLSNVGPAQRLLYRGLAPIAAGFLRDRLRITPAKTERSITRVFEELAAVEQLLSDGRRYLLGDRFSAADLAFATALAPALCVQPEEGMGARFPPPERLSGPARALVERVRGTPAGRFALRLFAEERRPG